MRLNRLFLFWYVLLALLLLLSVRFFVKRQWDEYAAITDNLQFQALLEQQYRQTSDPALKKTAGDAMSQYRQIDFYNRLLVRKNRMLFDGLLLVLFVGMVGLFMLGMHLITLPLRRVLKYSSEIAKGNLKVLPEAGKNERGLGALNQAFHLLIRDLKASQKHLAIAEKEKTWREIAQVLAHEIKNPLTPIRLSTELMAETLQEIPEKQRQSLETSLRMIQEELGRLEALVNNFRDFSRTPELMLSPVNMEELIKEVALPFQENLPLSLTARGGSPVFPVDRMKMCQVFLNLFKNSIEAHGRRVEIAIEMNAKSGTLRFRDDGHGFTSESANQAFIPYQTTKKNGTGLGLSIVKNIIEAHRGAIEINTDKKTGAEIIISLPLDKGQGA